MKTIKITCDRCGVEISGDPYRVFTSQVGRDTEDIITNGKWHDLQYDFCEECISAIEEGLTQKTAQEGQETEPEETEPEKPEQEPEAEPEEEEPKTKKHAGGLAKGAKLLTGPRKEAVLKMVRAGKSDEEIARELDMPVERITVYVNKTGYRGLVEERKQEPKPERVTASGVTFGI